MTDHFATLQKRADIYQSVFGSADGKVVLRDLMRQFAAAESVFSFVIEDGRPKELDVNYTLVLAAKRECFDYIANLLGLTYEDIVAMKFYAQEQNDDSV